MSQKSYTFKTFPDGQLFNAVAGVYIFCRPLASGHWEALYVGETQSLEERLNANLSNHEGYKRAKQLGMTHIGVFRAAPPAQRLAIEVDLIRGLNPSANIKNRLRGAG